MKIIVIIKPVAQKPTYIDYWTFVLHNIMSGGEIDQSICTVLIICAYTLLLKITLIKNYDKNNIIKYYGREERHPTPSINKTK